jgi:hypothetical protein
VDRRRTISALLIAASLLGARAPDPVPIREALWTVPQRQFDVLTTAPPECLTLPPDRDERRLVAIGRTIFQSPLLLGGHAARAGLSCASCHRNGRGNPDFKFPGLSSTPGTADVSSSLMSKVRGDGQFNPVRIPDLALDSPKVSRSASDPALRNFVRSLVVDEFDGAKPSPQTLDALVAYVRSLGEPGCAARGMRRETVSVQIGEVLLDLNAVRLALDADDIETAKLAITTIRHRLGQMAARFQGVKRDAQILVTLDKKLAHLVSHRDPSTSQMKRALDRWTVDFDPVARTLISDEEASLYNIERVRLWLARSAPI